MNDRHIAFTTFEEKAKNHVLGYFNLGSDKISATGDPAGIASGAAYPVYYGTGTRTLGTKPVVSFTSDVRSGSSPLNVQFVDMSDGNPVSWRWTFQGGSPSSSTQQHPRVTYNAAGTYAVTLVATNSYGSSEAVRQGYITTGATGTEHIMHEPLTVYPNPATDEVWITGFTGKPLDIRMFDLTGKTVPIGIAAATEKIRIDISRLNRGFYILQLTLADGVTLTRKIVKN
jgi:PKD repeat protein